jgi:hypothetical protein
MGICRHCGRTVENRHEPSMGGPGYDKWVHVPGGYTICYPQTPNSTVASPEEF